LKPSGKLSQTKSAPARPGMFNLLHRRKLQDRRLVMK
jgi:hypothetical protein